MEQKGRMMDLGLTNKTAVVLASTDGLAFGVARSLVMEGAKVAISGRNEQRLDRARTALVELADGDESRIVADQLDVTDSDTLRAHLSRASRALGPADILVTNAGGPSPGEAQETTLDHLDRAYELTLKSAVVAVQHVLPGMRKRKWGRIVAMTSQSVRHPIPGLALSNTMRPALTGWLKTLSREVACDGVLINTICTGLFDTDRLSELFESRAKKSGRSPEQERQDAADTLPVRRIGTTDEFGDMVAFMVSERASFLCGANIAYDGGASTFLL